MAAAAPVGKPAAAAVVTASAPVKVIDGAARRFLEQLRERREASAREAAEAFYAKPSTHELIAQLNMTKEERAAAERKRQEMLRLAAEELSKPVNVDGSLRAVDLSRGAVVAVQGVYDKYRPGVIKLHVEDQLKVFDERQADPRWRLPEEHAAAVRPDFERRREMVKITLHFDETFPLEEQRVFFMYSQALSENSLKMFSPATDRRLEQVTSARVRQMLIAPTEVWTPPLLLLLSGPDAGGDAPIEVRADGTADIKLSQRQLEEAADPKKLYAKKVERPALIGAPNLARYLVLVIESLKANTERQFQAEEDKDRRQKIQLILEAASKAFNDIDGERCAALRGAMDEAMQSMFSGLPPRDPKTDRTPPDFWTVYGTWTSERELLGGRDRAELERDGSEESLNVIQDAVRTAMRRSTVEKIAMYLHADAGKVSTLLCSSVMTLLGMSGEGSRVYFYGQLRVPLPKRPATDALRKPNGLSETWGYENLVAYVKRIRENEEMTHIAADKYGYDLDRIIAMLHRDRDVIIADDPSHPRETNVSGGALPLAWCYYATVIESILRPVKSDYLELLKKRPGSWVCALCDTLNPDQGACGDCMCPKIVKTRKEEESKQ